MKNPINRFKHAIQNKQTQIGFWQGMVGVLPCEVSASAGFDWLLIDGEHSPNDLQSLLHQLHVLTGYPETTPILRVPHGYGQAGAANIKQYLDIGAQTLLVPMIDTPEQALDAVRAVRYPPHGIRGVAGGRASRWGQIDGYMPNAHEEICLLVQAESTASLDNLEAICAVDGVDGVFIGPNDLAASLGYLGQTSHPEVLRVIDDTIARINKAGKASGILTPDEKLAQHYIDIGCTFVAVGIDSNVLMRATKALVTKFKGAKPISASTSGY